MVKEDKEKEDKWKEVSIDFHQFTQDGDELIGELVDKDSLTIRDAEVGKYTLLLADGKKVAFLGGIQLDPLMADIDVGTKVRLSYLGRVPTSSGMKVKTFKVFVAE